MIVNILFTRNEEGKGHYSFIRNMSRLMHSTTKSHKKKQVCPHCVDVYFHSQRALNNHLKERHPHLFHEHVCERCLNVFNTPEKSEQHKELCVVKDSNTRPVIFPSTNREKSGGVLRVTSN